MKTIKLFLLISFCSFIACHSQRSETIQTTETSAYQLSNDDSIMLDSIQHKAFLFFINEYNQQSGLVKDRSASWSPASIAATGFGVAAWIVGVEHNWITRQDAANKILTLVRFLINSDQRGDTNSTGYKGFYYHFLDINSGTRVWESELSTIDTGLLLAGLRFAYQYFNKNEEVEIEIRNLIDKITNRIEWDWMTLKEAKKKNEIGSLSMGWYPYFGFHDMGWVGYNEALILYILAAGSNYSNAESGYKIWLNGYEWKEPYKGLQHVIFPPLFGHQYTQCFTNLSGLKDEYMEDKGTDYFENSRRATLTQRQYAIDNPKNWKGYDSLCWGITACDGPGSDYDNGSLKFLNYAGRGTSGPELTFFDDGTIAPTAVAGSIVFAPEVCIPTLKNLLVKYGNKGLWDKYGLVDAFNPTVNWFDKDYIGIDQGPIVLMIENFRTGLVWNYVMKDPVVLKGLQRLGFEKK